MTAKYGLGKGLGSLIPKESKVKFVHPMQDIEETKVTYSGDVKEQIIEISVGSIQSNPWQPRTNFDKQKLEELVDSIRENGIIQPLIVTKIKSGYQLIAGERRLKSARILGMFRVPVIVREVENIKKLELSLIENIQRSNLNLLEEAEGYQKLIDEFNLTQEQVAKRVGKNRSTIANILRLRNLPDSIKKYLTDERISFGHAKLLLSLDSEKKQKALLKKILIEELNVSDTGEEVKKVLVKAHKRTIQKDPNILAKEEELRNYLNTKVKINNKKDRGNISIDYYSKEELNEILGKIFNS